MPDAALAIRTALALRLSGGAIGGSPGVAVYSNVPELTPLPYLLLGAFEAIDDGTKSEFGQDGTVQIDAWTEDDGPDLGESLLGDVYDLLHERETELTIAGFTTVMLRFDFGTSFLEPDGRTWHSTSRFRIVLQPE